MWRDAGNVWFYVHAPASARQESFGRCDRISSNGHPEIQPYGHQEHQGSRRCCAGTLESLNNAQSMLKDYSLNIGNHCDTKLCTEPAVEVQVRFQRFPARCRMESCISASSQYISKQGQERFEFLSDSLDKFGETACKPRRKGWPILTSRVNIQCTKKDMNEQWRKQMYM